MSQASPDAAAAPAAVEVRNLSQSFGERWAVRNASFDVAAGSLHGFVGPNGAGKTTTLKIVCTLLEPQAGSVHVFGQDVVLASRDVRRRIGFMPDHFSMYRRMSVFEYLDFFGAAYGLTTAHRDQVIKDVLALTDMYARRNDLIAGLSRGMQQRVSLSRVLVSDPDLLLLDEPASGLDPRARIELMEILKELQGMGKTIFISSHILAELAELCDSVTIIDAGRIKFSGSIAALLAHGEEHPTYRLRVTGAWPDLEQKLGAVKGIVNVERLDGSSVEGRHEFRISIDWAACDANSLLRNVLDIGVPIVSFNEEKRHLNEAFMDLTTGGFD
ncbi:MAG TPA: ABC transporter ATP-binding protein [Planctomycetaceae bacterium]|jgi:ABC-2 type transport system ATP-binding protein